jgi:hypothetical protein
MRLDLDGAIPSLFRFRRRADGLVGELRRSRLLLSRFGDDFRLPPFRFECLAKVAVKYLAETRNHCLGTHKLAVDPGGRRKLRKFVELLLQVKDLFLQIQLLSHRQIRLT